MQMRIAARQPVEVREVAIDSKYPRDNRRNFRLHRIRSRRRNSYLDLRTLTGAGLPDCDTNRRLADNQHATPDAVVEYVDNVMCPPAQRPHRQVETERWPRPKRERQLGHQRRPNPLFDFAVRNFLQLRGCSLAAL